AYIQPCRYDAWLWLPPQDPAAKPPPNRRPLWLPLHCAAARQEASLRFVPRQPNPQKKEQHQENYHASLPASFSPYCSLIKGTKTVQEMLARRGHSCRTPARRAEKRRRFPNSPRHVSAACHDLYSIIPTKVARYQEQSRSLYCVNLAAN